MMNRKDLYWMAALLALVGAVLVYSLDLRSFDFLVPFMYASDSLQYLAVFRTVLTTGWYTEPTLLGAPFGATHYDFPFPDGLFLLFVSALRPFTSSPAIAFNLLFIGGFFLVPAAFFYAARKLGVPRPLAAVGALAYGFLPFHFLRTPHLFYTLYFLPPLVVACAVMLGEPELAPLRKWLTWRKALLFVVTGAAGVYNAFLLILVLGFAALVAAITTRESRRLAHGAVAVGLIACSTLANLAPNVLHRLRAGANPEVAVRTAGESETYGLKLAQLLLPHPSHPLMYLSAPGRVYGASAFVTENHTSSLGLIGSAGFLLGLWWVFVRPGPSADGLGRRIDLLAKSNGFLFLVATVGGFSVLFAVLVTPQLRAWNRASVIIAAMSLFVLLLAITRFVERVPSESLRARRAAVTAVPLLLVWAVDQAPQRATQPAADRENFAADARFIAQAAASVPPGSMVLELPYTGFPEWGVNYQEGSYGMVRPYLHDSSLRWSFGDMRGRPNDLWLRALSARAVASQVEAAARKGFAAVYVERRAYADHGAAAERQIAALLGPPVVVRSDGETAFYRIPSRPAARDTLSSDIQLGDGFYGWERDVVGRWAWSKGDASLVISNPRPVAVAVVLRLDMQSLLPRSVRIWAPRVNPETLSFKAGESKAVELPLTLAPGTTRVDMATAEPAAPPGTADPRVLAFAIRDPVVEPR
jgi:phosphoglycerol transferase